MKAKKKSLAGKTEFKREVVFEPAFDKRHKDPKKNYGIHGVNIRFLLTGPRGVVQFLLFTNWHLPKVQKELDKEVYDTYPHLLCHPQPADIGYHAYEPQYEGQESMGPCEYLGGKKCYYDGSGLNAVRVYDILVAKGHEAVWKELEKYYEGCFTKEVADVAANADKVLVE